MRQLTAIDCQGLGGGIALGFVEAGFQIVEKFEQPGGFGFAQYETNRHLLGDFDMKDDKPEDWYPKQDVDLLFGCPPCSGFSIMSVRAGSGLNRSDKRGTDASINHCMLDWATAVRRAQPTVAVMESVTNAGRDTPRGGYSLMRLLAEVAGPEYTAYHVFHDAYDLGNVSHRKRFFLVLSKIPFGVYQPIKGSGTVGQLLGDLLEVPRFGMPGHVTWDDLYDSAHMTRLRGTLAHCNWPQGGQQVDAVHAYYDAHGAFPPGIDDTAARSMLWRPLEKQADYLDKMSPDDYEKKWNCPYPVRAPSPWQGGAYEAKRWRWDGPGFVMAGNSAVNNIHPLEDRLFTYREIARVMGFPDDWNVQSYMDTRDGYVPFGKAVTVDAARWIAECAAWSLRGEPFGHTGTQDDNGVWVIK